MASQNFAILTEAQKDAAEALNAQADGVSVEGRLVDAANPGGALNRNPLATEYEMGDPVPLTGGVYVMPWRIRNDPEYTLWHGMFDDLPMDMLEYETIFEPPEM